MRSLIILVTLLTVIFTIGCSNGASSPVIPGSDDSSTLGELNSLPVIAFDGTSAIGLFGAYNLVVSDDLSSAELVPMRSSSLGESFIVSGMSFFTMTPCADCLQLDTISLEGIDHLNLGMMVKHPFPKGITSQPPTASNRLDLDVFDLALVMDPISESPTTFNQTGVSVYTGLMVNADGYTREMEGYTGNVAALPYKICFEDSNNNRFEMGSGYEPFDLILNPGSRVRFDLYLTMGYGASAKKFQRLNPTYYVPEFNRKAAWKVEVTPPPVGDTWTEIDAVTEYDVAIDIYDWNHDVTVDSGFPDPTQKDMLSASSDVDSVTVEIPGMIDVPANAATTDTSSNGWDDPLTYTASIANENGLPVGSYWGLVKVTDSRFPPVPGEDDFGYGWGRGWDDDFEIDQWSLEPAVDGAGNVYVSGEFFGTVDFDPGLGEDIHAVTGGANTDVYLKKFDSDGNYLWGKSWGSWLLEKDYGTAVDNSGNIYMIGLFNETVDFDPGPETATRVSIGEPDVFLTKFDSDGNHLWVQTWGSDYDFDYVDDVCVDSNGNVFVTGQFEGLTDFDPGVGIDDDIADGFQDVYISGFDPSGNYLGVQIIAGLGAIDVEGITADTMGNIFVTGSFQGIVDFDPGLAEDWQAAANEEAPFVCKYNSSGNWVWAKSWGSATGWCRSYDLCADDSGNIYVVGNFDNWVDADPGVPELFLASDGCTDAFLSKLDTNGTLIWAYSWGGSGCDWGFGLDVDPDGYISVTGGYQYSVDFDPGTEDEMHTAAGEYDPYLTKFDSAGDHIWAKTWGGRGRVFGYGVACNGTSNIFVYGVFDGSVDLDPTDAEDNMSSSGESKYLVKFITAGAAPEGLNDTLVHSPDGIDLLWRYIPEFATYQTFVAQVE